MNFKLEQSMLTCTILWILQCPSEVSRIQESGSSLDKRDCICIWIRRHLSLKNDHKVIQEYKLWNFGIDDATFMVI